MQPNNMNTGAEETVHAIPMRSGFSPTGRGRVRMPPTRISREIHEGKRRIREAGMTSGSHRLRDRVATMAPLGLCVSDRVGPASLGHAQIQSRTPAISYLRERNHRGPRMRKTWQKVRAKARCLRRKKEIVRERVHTAAVVLRVSPPHLPTSSQLASVGYVG